MTKESIIAAFEKAHPKLLALSPIIRIDEITESFNSTSSEIIKYDPPLFQITISHQFVFDNRLVPKEFNGIKVQNQIVGSFPLEFPEPNEEILIEEYYATERYVLFIDRSLPLIRKTLMNEKMTKEEALIALKGDF
jgi:hypothetical protein